ncbi:PRC-barrel domain containing protein [Bradyrhizobium hipponense]|uniref:PRC-barrel domain containing protein n=1 Tax=Bradyrhizobium hipponense TaxID=2605638 RepID=A0A5S4YGH2_9BRAD|nr:PRC-barrel domain-containing protein [Bradyrhizobium hipponense]TYO63486.1 PRC-barrel domain containing protein [Bradyrhizobium hipponense]
MLMKSIAAGLAGTALLATVAFAQSPTATTDKAPTASTATTTSASGEWRASKMSGLKVYNESNENIGSVNDLLMDKSGAIKTAVIGVGGFLGMGEHLVAIPYDKLKFANEAIAYTGTGATSPPGRPASPTTTTGAATGTDKAATATSSASKWYPDHAVFNASKDELKNMPEFKYSE